jgi:hypothetical protein
MTALLATILAGLLPDLRQVSLEARVDADSMLAAGVFYNGTTHKSKRICPMIILYGVALWSMFVPLLTPWWQQQSASLKRVLKRLGA